MKNILFVLFIFLNFYYLTKCAEIRVNYLNYYVYYIRDKNVIVCSYQDGKNLDFSKVDIKRNKNDGFECLIDLVHDGIFNLNLKMMSVFYNSDLNVYEALDDLTTISLFNQLDIKIGYENIHKIEINHSVEATSIQLILQSEKGNLSYTTDSLCNNNLDKITACNFIAIDDGISKSKFLNLDFNFSSTNYNLILLEQRTNVTTNNCSPPCVNGMCSNASCYCKNGYMGENCALTIDSKVSTIVLIIFFILIIALGILLAYTIFWIFLCIFKKDTNESAKESDIIEHWSLSKA